ncbi:unnamed protein product [Linum trigynum]|uniref:Uncharacterized protein n=1 Tax=Linum trigynum TaxID=586398 RepID=A0AAV2F7S9_9ROSI
MESESSRPGGEVETKKRLTDLLLRNSKLKSSNSRHKLRRLTSAPPPNGVHGSSSQQQETPGGSAQPNGTSAPPPPSRPDLSYLEAHLTPGFLGDLGHGRPLAQTILEQPNPPNFQMPHHLP